jgi:hypothetical protein
MMDNVQVSNMANLPLSFLFHIRRHGPRRRLRRGRQQHQRQSR